MVNNYFSKLLLSILILSFTVVGCNSGSKHVLSETEKEAQIIADTLSQPANFELYIRKYRNDGEKRAELFVRQMYGKNLRDNSKFELAINQHDTCINLARELKDTMQLIIALNNQGTNFRRLGDMSEATDFHYEALELCDKISNDTSLEAKKNITRTYNGLGNVLLSLKNYDAAETMFRQALSRESKENNATGMAINLANLGSVKEHHGQLDSALVYYRQSLEYNICAKNAIGMSLCYMYIGKLAEKRGDVNEAFKYYRKSINISSPTGDAWHWLEPCICIGNLFIKEGQLDSAKVYLEKALTTAYTINSIDHLARLHNAFANLHEKRGDPAQALKDIHYSQAFSDSVAIEKSQNHIQNLRVNYESNKVKIAQEQARSEKNVRNIISVASFVIFCIFIYAFYLHTKVSKARKKILEAHEKVAAERQEFYRGVTHQLRTPITVVLGMTQQLRKYMPEDDKLAVREFDAINRQCQHLLNLVTEMIDYAKNGKVVRSNKITELTAKNVASADDIPSSYIVDENLHYILLAEDDPDIALLITEMLKNAGYNYSWAKDGKEALEFMNDNMPELLITDIMMPNMNGIELMKTIRGDENMCHMPIVVVSARVESDDKLIGIEAGAEVYLGKPFLPNELLLRVRKLLEQRETLRNQFMNHIQKEIGTSSPKVSQPSQPIAVPNETVKTEHTVNDVEPKISAEDNKYIINDLEEDDIIPTTQEVHASEVSKPIAESATPSLAPKERAFIDSVNKYITKHISDTALSSASLAEGLATTTSTLNRKLKNITSIDTTHYIRMHRIAKAKDLLINTDMSMVEIQMECGFETPSYFSRSFKAETGVTPSEFRKNKSI